MDIYLFWNIIDHFNHQLKIYSIAKSSDSILCAPITTQGYFNTTKTSTAPEMIDRWFIDSLGP